MDQSKQSVQSLLLENGQFLRHIIKSNPTEIKSILRTSSNDEVNAIGHVLHQICLGEIPMRQSTLQHVKQKRKLKPLEDYFQTDDSLKNFLKLSIHHKHAILLPFSTVLQHLLYPLVNRH